MFAVMELFAFGVPLGLSFSEGVVSISVWTSLVTRSTCDLLVCESLPPPSLHLPSWECPCGQVGDSYKCRFGVRSSLHQEIAAPLQDSCLGNPMDRGAWRAAVHEVAESQT